MRINVIGSGYVGLVSGTCLASLGHTVTLVERAPDRLNALRQGTVPISEPGLQELFDQNRDRIGVASAAAEAPEADLALVAVATPVENGEVDLGQLIGALDDLKAFPDLQVSIRSTLPPGTSHKLLLAMIGRNDGSRMSINPEFLRQGSAVEDFLHPWRIVIGRFPETSDEHLDATAQMYASIEAPRLLVSVGAAELIKNAANGFLALRLSFVNEIAALSEELDVDVEDVLAGVALDPRIGSSYLRPGLGFGGSCLPKELEVLAAAGRRHGLAMHVTRSAALVNAEQQDRFVRRIAKELGAAPARVALLGLSFKAGTGDLRGSPAMTVARRMLAEGHAVHAYDPVVIAEAAQAQLPNLVIEPTWQAAVSGASAVVIATEWPEFAALDWSIARHLSAGKLLFDGRNLLEPERMSKLGFAYRGIGRPPVEARLEAMLE